MVIDKELQQQGITESIVNFFHGRTKNSHMTITKVYKVTRYGRSLLSDDQEGIKVNVTLKANNMTHHAQYTINLAEIRQKKINLLLNNNDKC